MLWSRCGDVAVHNIPLTALPHNAINIYLVYTQTTVTLNRPIRLKETKDLFFMVTSLVGFIVGRWPLVP